MQALSVLAIVVFLVAALGDILHRRIPNALPAALAALALIRLGLLVWSGESAAVIGFDIGASLAVFCLGALAFHFNALGGGDVKLLAAGALWVGTTQIWPFLLWTVLGGGVLAGIVLSWGAIARHVFGRAARPSLPYGVAIAAGGIIATLPFF